VALSAVGLRAAPLQGRDCPDMCPAGLIRTPEMAALCLHRGRFDTLEVLLGVFARGVGGGAGGTG
jgi:hypothetical protein